MGIFSENDVKVIQTHLEGMIDPVHLVFVKSEKNCRYCRECRQLIMEFANYSDRIYVSVFDFEEDSKEIEELNIERVPAIIPMDKNMTDFGIRFYGIPSGYEFQSLLGIVLQISKNKVGLRDELKTLIARIQKPMTIQTFVTPVCSYCPSIVRLIHKMALLNPLIKAEMIEVTEFPELGKEANVKGVPKTIINKTFEIEGAIPEDQFIHKIVENFT